ncbi:pyridoxamine 5'-phosphate oxidase-domain-containing protein [Usnea florida]
MLLPTGLLLSIVSLVSASTPPTRHLLSNPSFFFSEYRIPTIHESAVLARRILNLSSIATLSTVFPSASSTEHDFSTLQQPPSDLGGAPVGLMDYYASCSPQSYNPTILAISIATTFRNTHAGSNVTLSLRWHPPATAPPSDDIYTYSPANMPRFSLVGYIEPIPTSEILSYDVKACFLDRHPDAKAWLPGNKIHQSWWGRLVVREVYWIGGFGDRAYIGWIPETEWSGVGEDEVAKARLIGEDGYEKYTGSIEQKVLQA